MQHQQYSTPRIYQQHTTAHHALIDQQHSTQRIHQQHSLHIQNNLVLSQSKLCMESLMKVVVINVTVYKHIVLQSSYSVYLISYCPQITPLISSCTLQYHPKCSHPSISAFIYQKLLEQPTRRILDFTHIMSTLAHNPKYVFNKIMNV